MDGIFGIVHDIRADVDVMSDTVTAVGARGDPVGDIMGKPVYCYTQVCICITSDEADMHKHTLNAYITDVTATVF